MQPIKEENEEESIISYQQNDSSLEGEKIIREKQKPRIIRNSDKSFQELNDEDERNSRYTQNNNNRFTQLDDNNIIENPLNYNDQQNENVKKDNLGNTNKKENNKKQNIQKPKIIQYTFKIIVVGDISVGKTSIINRFIQNIFNEEYKCTLNSENLKKIIRIDQNTIANLNIWDTAGEERFRVLTRQFYQDSHGALIIYDITNKESFNKVENWVKDIIKNAPPDCITMIIGNKSDLNSKRIISYDEANILSQRYNVFFFEVSAKNGNNVALAFEKLTYEIINKQIEEEKNENRYVRKDKRNTINLEDTKNNVKNGCCK